MRDASIIAEKIETIFRLSNNKAIQIDDLEKVFQPDLLRFIRGETLSTRDGKLSVGQNLYKKWLHKLRTKGFDYAIDFSK